ncbi:MAG TPA: asparagine synthase (glutamine-hydrolyzing) [Candidatus Aquilonibacter sp.]|nr:asparagine synthase (glutamine-hydrolyzing) [Candidatus Aquilonibacter sp.]
MCGIAGVVGPLRGFSRERFREMRDALSHRGPDDAGLWESPSGCAILGSRRLAILDLSASGHQPMEDRRSGFVIAFNGEIYNYKELSEDLAAKDVAFSSRSDTEVLLKSCEEWGDACLERLNGMFAFAIWDETRQELFAARDRFGEKPFYFYLEPRRELLAFASEIKALVAADLFEVRPDPSAVYAFLANREIDCGAETMFANVRALPAAHALRFSWRNRSLKIWRYWNLNSERELHLPNDRYAEEFVALLRDSVRIRLRSDVPVGSSLSGGLDSSTIVGLVAQENPQSGQETFSARFSDEALDEGRYIERMVHWAGVRNHATYPDPERLPYEMEALAWHQDEPFYSSSIYSQWCVMRLARDCDVTVLLDGQGGDEVLAGYYSYFSVYYARLFKKLYFPSLLAALCRYLAVHGRNSLPLIFSGLLPAGVRLSGRNLLRPRAIREDFRRQWARPPQSAPRTFRDPVHESLYDSLTRTSLPPLLRYADRNSMAFSREVRLPFLDHRLVEYLFAIPSEQKIDAATTKIVLRNATEGILPEEIRWRTDKLGFSPPEVAWLLGPLRAWVDEVFSSARFKQREWLDESVASSVWRRFKNGERALHTSIWRWLSLEVWARTCLVRKGSAPGSHARSAIATAAIN